MKNPKSIQLLFTLFALNILWIGTITNAKDAGVQNDSLEKAKAKGPKVTDKVCCLNT
jgi:hypothetical protein